MLSDTEAATLERRMETERELNALAAATAVPVREANAYLAELGERAITEPQRAMEIARRPRVGLRTLLALALDELPDASLDAWMSVEIELKYAGYLAREREAATRLAEMTEFVLPADTPYDAFKTLSTEARQKLARVRPTSLAQAARIPGVSPSDLQNLILEVVRRRRSVA
jgi:tRNA uridine 5-carboxymethylaminomethyl modification enzyme